jgi:hypothetical protein
MSEREAPAKTTVGDDMRRIGLAYLCLIELDRRGQIRALKYLDDRLRSDMLTAEAAKAVGIKPQKWALFDTPEFADTPDEIIEEYGKPAEVLEIDGWAVVQRRFGVRFLIGDDQGHVDGSEVHWFDDRATAEVFADMLKAAGNRPQQPKEPKA